MFDHRMAQKQNSCTQIIVLQNLKQSTEEVSNMMDTTKSESNEASMLHFNNNLKCYNTTAKVYGT